MVQMLLRLATPFEVIHYEHEQGKERRLRMEEMLTAQTGSWLSSESMPFRAHLMNAHDRYRRKASWYRPTSGS